MSASGNMHEIQQALLRALIAAQVAALEWGEKDIDDDEATAGLDEALKQCMRLARKLRDA